MELGVFFCWMQVFHYEYCHVLPLCPHHNHFWKEILYFSIMTILLMLFVIIRMWLIIRLIMLSTPLLIMIWFSITDTICLLNLYISSNWCNVLLISGLVPMIIISSSSIGYFLICSLIFLEKFDALLNAIFFCCCSWASSNIIVLIIDNERENRIGTQS